MHWLKLLPTLNILKFKIHDIALLKLFCLKRFGAIAWCLRSSQQFKVLNFLPCWLSYDGIWSRNLKKTWKYTVKKMSNKNSTQCFLCLFSQSNVLLGFINKRGRMLFETCLKISSKGSISHHKVWAFMKSAVEIILWNFFLQCTA